MEQGCHDGNSVPLDDHVADLRSVAWVVDERAELDNAVSELGLQARPGLLWLWQPTPIHALLLALHQHQKITDHVIGSS